ncbi:MAG: caspase family protein [Spirochaetia bacterium]
MRRTRRFLLVRRARFVGRFMIVLITLFLATQFLSAQEAPLRRFGLFIGANDGGSDRIRLRWAIADAERMAGVMTEIGGIRLQDSYVLEDPTGRDLEFQFEHLKERIRSASETARRTELIFYYSGHSDESGIKIGGDNFSYVDLRRSIDDLGADVSIAILDSCASGAFTRLKGGSFIQPFLVDTSSDVSGHAFLTSSSESEASQESDQLGSSFFTYFLVSGLRGAADLSNDGTVTLDEVYLYAREETLARTTNTFAGPQHAAFDFQLTGTGSLVLTDLTVIDAAVVFHPDVGGRLFINRASGGLVAEVQKSPGNSLTMALPAGSYIITLQGADRNYQHEVVLPSGTREAVESKDFRVTFRDRNRSRGNEVAAEPVTLTVLPGIRLVGEDPDLTTIALGLIVGVAYRVQGAMFSPVVSIAAENLVGVQLAGVGNVVGGNLTGLQSAGVFNVVNGNSYAVQNAGVFNHVSGRGALLQSAGVYNIAAAGFNGIQSAGVFNLTEGPLNGVQLAGVYNQAGQTNGAQISLINIAGDVNGAQIGLVNIGKTVVGTQIGLVNISEEMYGIPIGLATFVERGIHDVSVWFEGSERTWLGIQNGSNIFYTIAYAGVLSGGDWKQLDGFGTGVGVGFRVTTRPFYLDVDVGWKRMTDGVDAQDRFISLFDPARGAAFPTARVMVGMAIGDGLGWYIGGSFDIDSPLASDAMGYFSSLDPAFSAGAGGATMGVYPKFFTGFKF